MSGARKAIEALGAAGISVAAIAEEIGVTRETVRRWSIGRHAPNARNGLALRQLVDRLLNDARYIRAGVTICAQVAYFQTAKDALSPSITASADSFALHRDKRADLWDRIDAAFAPVAA